MKATRCLPILLPFLCLGSLAQSLEAQTKKVLPPQFKNLEGDGGTTHPFGSSGVGRLQHLMLGSSFCKSTALLRACSLRVDGGSVHSSFKGRKIPKLNLWLSSLRGDPSGMSRLFSGNRQGKRSLVFSGAFNLPALTRAAPGPFMITMAWGRPYVYQRRNDSLLLELEIPGRGGNYIYEVDAAKIKTAGSSQSYGTSGPFKTGDKMLLRNIFPSKLVPGGSAWVEVSGLKRAYPALIFFGFSRTRFGTLPLPFNLAALKAPKNWLYTSIDLVLPVKLGQSPIGWTGSITLPIPPNPKLQGLALYAQSFVVDPASNGLGLVWSNATQMDIARNSKPARTLASFQSAAIRGRFLTLGPIEEQTLVIELTGAFN